MPQKKVPGLTVPRTCLLVDAVLPRTGSPTDRALAIVDYRRARNAAAPNAAAGTAPTCSGYMKFRCTNRATKPCYQRNECGLGVSSGNAGTSISTMRNVVEIVAGASPYSASDSLSVLASASL